MDEKGGILGGKERGMVEVLKLANEAERAKVVTCLSAQRQVEAVCRSPKCDGESSLSIGL
jgi:hypothetical protein